MSIAIIVLLTVLLIASTVVNVLLFRAGERQLAVNATYLQWIKDCRTEVFKTYAHMKMLDDKEMFSKDDEVGMAFTDMVTVLEDLNSKVQEEPEGE